ncbi:MAG: hypothetical protein Q9227_001566 [Pyrenula ochraceoflavens]
MSTSYSSEASVTTSNSESEQEELYPEENREVRSSSTSSIHSLDSIARQRLRFKEGRWISRDHKWRYFRHFYHDEYLDLIRSEENPDDAVQEERTELEDLTYSQNGAVSWTAGEKADLFVALARRGRFDVPALAAYIGSKSVVEVQAYLHQLQLGASEAQLFNSRHHGVSISDIPAAIEIGSETEKSLDKAAQALCLYQERYQDIVGRERFGDRWLTDIQSAKAREVEADENGTVSDEDNFKGSSAAEKLLNIPAMMELSEKIFMNRSMPNADDNWRKLAALDERPAVNLDFLEEFYEIALNMTRKVMQSCIYVAMSRLRASRYERYAPSKLVKVQDVQAAVHLLGLNNSSWDYWRNAPRRCGLQVVDVKRSRGYKGKLLSANSIERALAQKPIKRRGRRLSLSSSGESSLQVDSTESEEATTEETDSVLSESNSHGNVTSDAQSDVSDSTSSTVDDTSPESRISGNEDSSAEDVENLYLQSLAGTLVQPSTSAKRKYKQFKQDLLHEAYATHLDEDASRIEEKKLLKTLNRDDILDEDEHMAPSRFMKPNLLRKTRDELIDWKDTFLRRHVWEDHPVPISESIFLQNRRGKSLNE